MFPGRLESEEDLRMSASKGLICACMFLILLYGIVYADFISEITEMSFPSEVLDSDMPVMVWFSYTEHVIVKDPFRDGVDSYAEKNIKRIKTLRMDSKFNVITAQKYKITRNNTFVIFIEGEEKGRSTDIRSEKDLANFVNKYVPPLEEKKK